MLKMKAKLLTSVFLSAVLYSASAQHSTAAAETRTLHPLDNAAITRTLTKAELPVLTAESPAVETLYASSLSQNAADDDLMIYNAVSPNGDNLNDYFKIDGITNFPNNSVTIYNRWGVKVFETKGYDSNGNNFNGYSQGRVTTAGGNKLPDGTYFYIIEYESAGNQNKTAGCLYLSGS
jgi:gliding motility-associated-like protein